MTFPTPAATLTPTAAISRRAIALLAVTETLALSAAAPARADRVDPVPNPAVLNLMPPPGEVVVAGRVDVGAVGSSDAGITDHHVKVDGREVEATRTGDWRAADIVARVQLTAGDHIAEVTVTDWEGRTVTRSWRFSVSDLVIERLSGVSRIETSVAISRDLYPDDTTATAAVLARSDDFADALAGAPFAYERDAPLLLTDRAGLSPATAEELQRVLPSRAVVYLLGGLGALHENVERDVQALGFTTRRLGGDSRFATAADIANESLRRAPDVVVASGSSFPDALAASSPAARDGMPILLTSA